MGKPIRVLQVFASLDRGGAETMIMNLYRSVDRNKVQFDFVANERTSPYSYEAEILALGGKIFYAPRYIIFNHIQYKRAWKKLLKEHPEWQIIHIHNTTPAYIYIKVAKRLNKLIIAHSHTSGKSKTLKSKIKHLMQYPLRDIADYLFACSKDATDYMFGANDNSAKIINNAIEVEKYIFNKDIKDKKRKEFGISDKFVIGHIGNFSKAKNYPFILDTFNSILIKESNAILILVGKSENDPEVKKRVKELKLEDKVIFTGVRSDIYELLQAMDVFLFPSLYEGLPVALIEAQSSGLQCVVSDTITEEVKITDLVDFISLDKSPEYWAEQVLKYSDGYERKNTYKEICNSGYDVKENAKWLQDFYLEEHSKICSKHCV